MLTISHAQVFQEIPRYLCDIWVSKRSLRSPWLNQISMTSCHHDIMTSWHLHDPTMALPSLRKPCMIWLSQVVPLPGTPTRKTSDGRVKGKGCRACHRSQCEGMEKKKHKMNSGDFWQGIRYNDILYIYICICIYNYVYSMYGLFEEKNV